MPLGLSLDGTRRLSLRSNGVEVLGVDAEGKVHVPDVERLIAWARELHADATRYRFALRIISEPDALLGANPDAFGAVAARRMQDVAKAALYPSEGDADGKPD